MTEYTKYKILDVKKYDYDKYGGTITLVFDNGVSTKRNFTYIKQEYTCVCSLSGDVIPSGSAMLRVLIKRSRYGLYLLSEDAVQKALRGEYKQVDNDDTLVRELKKLLTSCQKEYIEFDKKSSGLRKALYDIKLSRSEVGKKMSRANVLLEVLQVK